MRLEVRGVPFGTGDLPEFGDLPIHADTVSLHTERGPVHRESLTCDGAGAVEWSTTPAEAGFVRVEVRQDSGAMAALSNPVFLC